MLIEPMIPNASLYNLKSAQHPSKQVFAAPYVKEDKKKKNGIAERTTERGRKRYRNQVLN